MEEQKDKTEKKYIPLYFDALFYKVFGEEDKLDSLIYLIEQTLKVKIKDIKLLSGKVLGDNYKTKRSYLDLLVSLNNDTKLNIEINTNTSKATLERNLIFIFKVMGNDIKIKDKYTDLLNYIQINLNHEESKDSYDIEKYVLMEEKSHKLLTDKLQILKINLSFYANKCYTSSELNELSDFEKLMGLIGARNKEEYNIFSSQEGMLRDIMDTADKFRDDSDIIEMYDRETEMNRIHELEKREAIKEAIDEKDRIFELEKKEATLNSKKEIAYNMLNMNMRVEDISKATGLSIREVNDLKNSK